MGAKRKGRPGAIPAAAEPTEPTFQEWKQGLTTREQRVNEVVGMMLRGVWVIGASDDVMAQKWNCSPGNVRQISAEASRNLRAMMRQDPEAQKQARAMMLAAFEAIRMKCMLNGDSSSLRVALDAMRAYGFYMGIEPAKRLEVTDRSTPVDEWSLEEKIAYARDGKRPVRAFRGAQGELAGGGGGTDDGSMH